MGYFYWGGAFLAASGCDRMVSGQRRFDTAVAQCEKSLVSLDPPRYSLKRLTDTCVKLEEGVAPQDLLSQFERQALEDRQWGIGKFVAGTASAIGAVAVGIGVPLLRRRFGRTSQ